MSKIQLPKPILVRGQNLAALATTCRIADLGGEVYWHRNDRSVGFFSGVQSMYGPLDIGMVLLELGKPGNSKFPVYEGQFGHQLRPHWDWVRRWVQEESAVTDVQVFSYFRGETWGDFFISDSLEILESLSSAEQTKVALELNMAIEGVENANNFEEKTTDPWFEKTEFTEGLRASLGSTLFGLIVEPVLLKLAGKLGNLHHLRLKDHRTIWMPLYRPSSVQAALQCQPLPFQPVQFHQVLGGSFARLVHNKHAQILRTTLEDEPEEGIAVDFRSIQSPLPPATPLMGWVFFAEISHARDATYFLIDEFNCFRVNARKLEGGVGVATFEFGAGSKDVGKEAFQAEIRKICKKLGLGEVVRFLGEVEARYPASGPSRNSRMIFEEALSLGGQELIRVPIGPLRNALNDQILAGLGVADLLERRTSSSVQQ